MRVLVHRILQGPWCFQNPHGNSANPELLSNTLESCPQHLSERLVLLTKKALGLALRVEKDDNRSRSLCGQVSSNKERAQAGPVAERHSARSGHKARTPNSAP